MTEAKASYHASKEEQRQIRTPTRRIEQPETEMHDIETALEQAHEAMTLEENYSDPDKAAAPQPKKELFSSAKKHFCRMGSVSSARRIQFISFEIIIYDNFALSIQKRRLFFRVYAFFSLLLPLTLIEIVVKSTLLHRAGMISFFIDMSVF